MNGQLLWYLSRATGVVAMVLLTVVACTGIVTSGRRRPAGQRATVVMAVHRWLSVGMLVFLVAHIVTAIADGYVPIGWLSVVVPFTSGYEPLLRGVGTLAVDLLIAVLVTSWLRQRIPERAWRGIHWATYAMWGLALVHGVAMGTSNEPLLRGITIACGAVGVVAVVWRMVGTHADRARRLEISAQEWS